MPAFTKTPSILSVRKELSLFVGKLGLCLQPKFSIALLLNVMQIHWIVGKIQATDSIRKVYAEANKNSPTPP